MKMIRFCKFTKHLTVLFLCSEIQASPFIEVVELNDGLERGVMELVVNGEGFGEGPNLAYYNNFNDYGSERSISQSLSEGIKKRQGTANLVDSPKVMSFAGRQGFQVVNSESGTYNIMKVSLGGQYDEVFVSYGVAIPDGYTAPNASESNVFVESSWKMSWLLEGDSAFKTKDMFDLCVPTQVGNSTYIGGNSSKLQRRSYGDSYRLAKYSNWWQWDAFNHINFSIKANLLDNELSDIHFSTMNAEFGLHDYDIVSTEVRLAGPNVNIGQINFPGWVRKTDSDNFQAIYDDIYIAVGPNAKARVELTDNIEYEKSSTRIPIPSLSWNNNSVTLDLSVADLRQDIGYYVHLFNWKGERTVQGANLNWCSNCAKSPGGLRRSF